MKKLLLVNDDGIKADGMRALVEALRGKAEMYIFAPDSQKSATSHSITIGGKLTYSEVSYDGVEKAFSIDGTPGDCVKMGLKVLERRGIIADLVFSGINMGANLGTDTLYSGTVSAAMEGALSRKPAVAVSVNSHRPENYEAAQKLALDILKKSDDIMPGEVININAPDLPLCDIKGVICSPLGMREYQEWLIPEYDEKGREVFAYKGKAVWYPEKDPNVSDVIAMQEQYCTITPLHFNFTNYARLNKFKEHKFEL